MIAAENIMEMKGVRPTANRILVLRALIEEDRSLSLSELELLLPTMDKSSIFRALAVLAEHHVLHSIEDGDAILRYEVCHNHHHCSVDDMHVHFYCTQCRRTFCLTDVKVPIASLPDGYAIDSVNYMAKGTCPECAKRYAK